MLACLHNPEDLSKQASAPTDAHSQSCGAQKLGLCKENEVTF